jgi:hypothetical protein
MLKSLIPAVALASALAAPAVSFAQSNGPVTRAQVRAELVQLEQAGWRPAMGMGNNRITRPASKLPKPGWRAKTVGRAATVAWSAVRRPPAPPQRSALQPMTA